MSEAEKFALGSAKGTYRGAIQIGLVNNMPDAALRATELQFARLLKEAAGPLDVQLRLFSFPEIARSEQARSRMEGFYADADTIPAAGLDALIITGAEPLDDDLRRENYWGPLVQLIDWAERDTISSLFSCLAAHAAVLHLSDIPRQKLPRKLSGVFDADRACDHPLLTGMAPRFQVPHSRRNTLAESALTGAGYQVLARLTGGEVDSFARAQPGRSLFLFLQGHPEYGAETLGREYMRDTGRFLHGESPGRPAIPEQYFDRATENTLELLDADAHGPADLARYTRIVSGALPLQSWRSHTIKLYGNWLVLIAQEKARRLTQSRPQQRKKLRV